MDSSIESKLKMGAVLMIAMRWAIRLMGLFSTIILARILAPEDFGIIAMAMVLQAFMEGVVNLNVELALIRNQEATPAHYDSAWTIGILQFGLVSSILFLISGAAADFYQESSLQPVIWVISLALFLRGLVNIGIVDFRKQLDFERELKYQLIVNGIRVLATIGMALWLRSYWAMALGILAGSIASVVVSYWMNSYRPRLCLTHGRDIMNVSAGVWLVNLNRFFAMQADRLIMGRLLPMSGLGGYSLAIDLARLPSSELILPVSRAMIPGYAKVKQDQPRLTQLFQTVLRVTTLLGIPVAFGFPLIAADFTYVVLGQKWMFVVPMLKIAAVMGVIELLGGVNRPLLLAAGAIKPMTIVLTLDMLAGVSVIYPAFLWNGTEAVLLALTAVRFAGLIGLFYLSAVTLQVGTGSLFSPVLRPFIAGLTMAGLLLPIQLLDLLPIFRLMLMISLGGLLYIAAVYILWRMAARPAGIEQMIFEKIRIVFARS